MRLRVVRGIVLSAVAAALVTPAHAETPSASTVPALAPWTRFVLPNGLVALVGERPGIPIVVVRAAVEAGSVLDPPRRIANLAAPLLTRENATRNALEADRAIELVGGSLESEGASSGAGLGGGAVAGPVVPGGKLSAPDGHGRRHVGSPRRDRAVRPRPRLIPPGSAERSRPSLPRKCSARCGPTGTRTR